jgi:hypothetical protein
MFIKEIINALTAPYFLITAAAILLLVSLKYPKKFYTTGQASLCSGNGSLPHSQYA